jgi:hypothetical protein
MAILPAVALVLLFAAIYFLAAGVAFALMYRIGPRFPSRAVGKLFAPLEWLSGKAPAFRRLYNGLCVTCYRVIVGGPLHNGWPPPPPGLPH